MATLAAEADTPDPECCDGSDEWQSGACPDNCEQIAREYRERVEFETKIRRTGAKIRSTYVNFALKEKKRLETELETKRAEIAERQQKVEEARRECAVTGVMMQRLTRGRGFGTGRVAEPRRAGAQEGYA